MQCPIELLRRVLAIAAMLAGAWMVVWPGPPLLVVSLADFEQQYERLPGWRKDGAGPEAVQRFVDQRTQGRMRPVSGPQWVALAARLAPGERRLYPAGQSPFHSLAPLDDFQYLRVAAAEAWIRVERQWPQEVIGGAGGLGHPWRLPGLALIAGALLLYFLLPRRRQEPGALHYSRAAAVVLPDLLALLLAPVFVLMPAQVVWSVSPGTSPLSAEGGWIWLTAVLWVLALLALALLAVGLRFSCWRLELTHSALRLSGLRGVREVPFDAIDACTSYRGRRSRRLSGALLRLASHPMAPGMALLLRGNEEHGIELQLRGGKRLRIMTNALQGRERLIDALQGHGIAGSGGLEPLR